MSDPEIDALLRRGEIEQAAAAAKRKGMHRRAAELFALVGRHSDGVLVAMEAGDWRQAIDLCLAAGDERLTEALCDEIGRHESIAQAAAAHARISHRGDIAARVLEKSAPRDAAQAWYESGEYKRAAACWDRAGDRPQSTRAFEQHLAQYPDDHEAAERLAELRAQAGDDEGAVRALQLAARGGGGASVLRKLVDGLTRIGLEGSARVVARRLRASDPAASVDPEAYAGSLPRNAGHAERYAGRYRVVRQVGSGATGRVLEAVDELTGEPVALKILSVGDDRGGAFGRFMREAELARVMEHPTLVRMRALDPEGPTIVYDWMPGGTLGDRIATLRIGEVRAVAMRLLSALEILHRNGVVHRDLKPSNVLFDPAGQARLGDLGAAHLGDLGATVTGGLVGSLPYMAPEQITGEAVSAATDLYAFGCVLFQMLTGSLPFAGPDFVAQHLNDAPPKVSSLRPALATEYDAVLDALLAKNPLDRPADADAARRLLQGLSWVEPDDEATRRARTSLRPSSSPAGDDEGARLVPSVQNPGGWRDTRLERELELVALPHAARALLGRWSSASSSDLQPVYELQDTQTEVLAWVEPLRVGAHTEAVHAGELDEPARTRVLAALESIGVDRERAVRAPVLTVPRFGALVPVSSLAELAVPR